MPAVLFLIPNRRQNPGRFTALDDADNSIRFRPFEIRIDKLVSPTVGRLQDGCAPFLRAILDPVVKLRCNIAQDISTDRIQVALLREKTNDALFLLQWLNRRIEQDSIKAAVMESDVIFVMLVESVHGAPFSSRQTEG